MSSSKYFAYIRVSTVRQGQTGTSLTEQRAAIEHYARNFNLTIIKEFEVKFLKAHINYIWLSEKDSGIYDAWNKGLKKANSNWIAFLGSDDTYYPNALEMYNQAMNNSENINYISSRVELINSKGKVLKIIGKPYSYKQMIRYMDIAHVGSFHHKDLFKKYGNFDTAYKIVGDYDFFLKCGTNIKAGYFNQVSARMLNEGASNQNVNKVFREVLKTQLNHKKTSVLQAYFEYYYNHVRICKSLLLKTLAK